MLLMVFPPKTSKMGDGNAAVAVTRVPGVSVQGGKYVYVRGLGDRYTKTTFNGLDIPGLDPDRNSLQMDIFLPILWTTSSYQSLSLLTYLPTSQVVLLTSTSSHFPNPNR